MKLYIFIDPEGNGIEVYRDRPSSSWEWQNGKVKMDTLEVDSQTLLTHRTDEGWARNASKRHDWTLTFKNT